MALVAAIAALSSACGARSGLNENAFGAGANGGTGVGEGSAATSGNGAAAGVGAGVGAGAGVSAGGAASMGSGGFGATSAFGGSAGSSHSGGAAGTSGVSGAGGRACGLLIDDMEDGTGRICTGSGRIGAWYEYNDGFGVQLPPQTPGLPLLPLAIPVNTGRAGRAMFSSHHYPNPGGPQAPQSWGAGIGVDLAYDGKNYGTYDASGMSGISFWVRSDIYKYYEVRINTTDTTPMRYGGSCPRDYCGRFARGLRFKSQWTQEVVSYRDIVGVSDTGELIDFHPERLTNIQFFFVIYPTDSYDGQIWLDDLRFTPGPPPPH